MKVDLNSSNFGREVVGHQEVARHGTTLANTDNYEGLDAGRCWNLSRGIMPCALRSWTTCASALVITNSSGVSPSTKLTRQSAQSGVPRRMQSLQLIDNSMPFVISHLSSVPTLMGVCDISEEGAHLVCDL